VVAVLGALLALGACGSHGDTRPAVSPTVPAPSVVALGQKVAVGNGRTVQVYGYQANLAPAAVPHDATRSFSAIDVEGCAGEDGDGSAITPAQFKLVMPDDSRIAPTPVIAEQPPLHPVTGRGTCSRGTVSYEVRRGQTPVAVSYVASDANVRWRVA
jgi:hypothetical protein